MTNTFCLNKQTKKFQKEIKNLKPGLGYRFNNYPLAIYLIRCKCLIIICCAQSKSIHFTSVSRVQEEMFHMP